MFPLLTQGFPTPQSKISYIYLIKLLASGMTLLDFPQNSTVNHFSASFLTAMHPEFLSFSPLASSALHWGEQCTAEGSYAAFQSWLVAGTQSPLQFQSLKPFQCILLILKL